MSRISEYLTKECCIMDLQATGKEEAIKEMASVLTLAGMVKDEQLFIHDIMAREKLGSTGIGHKIAIPHSPTKTVKGFVIGFARSKAGVDFQALDGDKVNLIFIMGTNPEELSMYLNLLAQLSRVLCEETVRKELIMAAKTADDVINVFKRFEREG